MQLRTSPATVPLKASPRLGAVFLLLALSALTASAQPAAPTAERLTEKAAATGSRPDQAIERIRNEDAGSRIDELRVGGQIQSITVQPKNDMPAYEIKPANAVQGAGNRVWNFMKF